jgi:hypothetical protein
MVEINSCSAHQALQQITKQPVQYLIHVSEDRNVKIQERKLLCKNVMENLGVDSADIHFIHDFFNDSLSSSDYI